MAHKHKVYDTDTHFSVNPTTRVLKNESSAKTSVIQHDHNSERFTFEIPRYIEEHDMSLCNVIQVHYNNIDAQTKAQSQGVYDVIDMQISPDDDDVVICSWLISQNATEYVGSLNFLVRFSCVEDDGTLSYAWNTAVYSGVSVSTGIYNSEVVVEEYVDVLEQWRQSLFESKENEMRVSVSGNTLIMQNAEEATAASLSEQLADGSFVVKKAESATNATSAKSANALSSGYTTHTTKVTPKDVGVWGSMVCMQNGLKGTTLPTDSWYDCLMMHNYGADDLPVATALAVKKTLGNLTAHIASGSRKSSSGTTDDTEWTKVVELITSDNIGSQSVSHATNADNAINANNAKWAEKAVCDENGNNIAESYLLDRHAVKCVHATVRDITVGGWYNIGTVPERKSLDDIMLVGMRYQTASEWAMGIPPIITNVGFNSDGINNACHNVSFQISTDRMLQIKINSYASSSGSVYVYKDEVGTTMGTYEIAVYFL